MKPKGIVLKYGPHNGASSHHPVPPTQTNNLIASLESEIEISSQNNDSDDKNLMPSMVVRQQRNQSNNNINDYDFPIKTKASSSSSGISTTTTTDQIFEEAKKQAHQAHQQHSFDQDGLILPRRVLPYHNGTQDGQKPNTIRDLNRELKFNQVRGKNVLDQKSELKKAIEKLEANKRRKEAEQERLTRRTSLELRLEKRVQSLALKEESSDGQKKQSNILSN